MERGNPSLVKLSKKLSWALRHGIAELGLNISASGYVSVSDLLKCAQFKSFSINGIRNIVTNCEKQRFDLREIDGVLMIRANQGHTITQVKDEELLTPILNPFDFPTVLHGTNKAAWKTIKSRGLYKMKRNHIHFAVQLPGNREVISGARVNCNVFIYIDLQKCLAAGMKFFVSQNRVILTPGFEGFVSPEYFSKVLIDRVEYPVVYEPLYFDYFLVLDFEANCAEKETLRCQEIIEFPVQVLNAQSLATEFTFHSYVKPHVVPDLSQFCTELTGITQDMVKNERSLEVVLTEFESFLRENGISGKKWVFVTCGDWDLKTCLSKEAEYKRIELPSYFKNWVNIKFLVPCFKGGMMELLSLLDIGQVGRHHSGIDDVRNILECLRKLVGAGVKLSEEDIRGDLNVFRSRV